MSAPHVSTFFLVQSLFSIFLMANLMSTREQYKLNKLALASALSIATYNHQLEQFTSPRLKSARQRLIYVISFNVTNCTFLFVVQSPSHVCLFCDPLGCSIPGLPAYRTLGLTYSYGECHLLLFVLAQSD